MSFTGTYPGVYIQELPSSVHSISAAPTSIAAIVGYTHPFLTAEYGKPVQLFGISDYIAQFGGFFSSPWQPDYVGQAVNQFFLNGGSTAYVVGLKPTTYFSGATPVTGPPTSVGAAHATVGDLTFVALQPVGVPATATAPAAGIPMSITISNVFASTSGGPLDTADIVVAYAAIVETYRRVPVSSIETAMSGSALVTAQLTPPAAPAEPTYPAAGTTNLTYTNPPNSSWTVISPSAFGLVLEDNAPLDKVSIFNLLVIPGITDPGVMSQAVAYCERKRAFLIMDAPADWDVDTLTGGALDLEPSPPISPNAALYFPWLQTTDPLTQAATTSPPSGFVAGAYAAEDAARGVWKSPAGIETALLGTTGVVPTGAMTDAQQGVLNPAGVNCVRDFPAYGTVVFGARTTAGNTYQQWRYIAVRRMALFIEQSLYASLTWAVFEPNADPLWQALTQETSAFMLSLFRQGAFAGTTPSDAFLVQCDETTTTPTDVLNGTVNLLVGFAPLLPAEFVVIQIEQLAGQASS